MPTIETIRCESISPGVEVVTVRDGDGAYTSTINGGRLDGQTFSSLSEVESLHDRTCLLARASAWQRGRGWRRRV